MIKNILTKLLKLFKKEERPPQIFFTSDLHFGHNNVINYCERPWKNKEAMNKGLVKLWNKQVRKDDIVFILGDFSLSPKAVLEFAPKLNGKKHLICGNHDAPFDYNTKRKAENMRSKYLDNFETVEMEGFLTLKNGVNVLLKHFPYSLEFDQRYRFHRPKDQGGWLLHGHLHCAYVKNNKQIDVGIDHNFKLYSEDDIIALMNNEQSFIPSRLTGLRKNRTNDDTY